MMFKRLLFTLMNEILTIKLENINLRQLRLFP